MRFGDLDPHSNPLPSVKEVFTEKAIFKRENLSPLSPVSQGDNYEGREDDLARRGRGKNARFFPPSLGRESPPHSAILVSMVHVVIHNQITMGKERNKDDTKHACISKPYLGNLEYPNNCFVFIFHCFSLQFFYCTLFLTWRTLLHFHLTARQNDIVLYENSNFAGKAKYSKGRCYIPCAGWLY